MTAKVIKKFKDRLTGVKYAQGSSFNCDDNNRIQILVNKGYIEAKGFSQQKTIENKVVKEGH